MSRSIFILVPSDIPTGPVKGAYALANALAGAREVTLVTLRRGTGAQAALDARVTRVCLADYASRFRGKLKHYRSMLREAGGRSRVASLSMCLSSDALNALCRREAVTCASVRGNLVANYRLDYGWVGVPLAVAHLFLLRWHDEVVAMTASMARQIRRFAGRNSAVIGNFVDEAALEAHRAPAARDGPLRFVFVGSISQRKQPWLIVNALSRLIKGGQHGVVDFIGTGPLEARVAAEARRLGIDPQVHLRGFVECPFDLLSRADAMVLPSLSEGMSRAALEALHLGVPCVLRDADGNAELIRDGENGALFADDATLADAMSRAARISRSAGGARASLLPAAFRQAPASQGYLELLESIHD